MKHAIILAAAVGGLWWWLSRREGQRRAAGLSTGKRSSGKSAPKRAPELDTSTGAGSGAALYSDPDDPSNFMSIDAPFGTLTSEGTT